VYDVLAHPIFEKIPPNKNKQNVLTSSHEQVMITQTREGWSANLRQAGWSSSKRTFQADLVEQGWMVVDQKPLSGWSSNKAG